MDIGINNDSAIVLESEFDLFFTNGEKKRVEENYKFPKADGYPIIRDFVAIDFETAKGKNPCQIGLAIVKDGKIIESINRLIKPTNNDYSPINIAVHHIKPCMTENAPSFTEVWDDIKHYFQESYIVAHNARFDMGVLQYSLRINGIQMPKISGYICTCDLNHREGLELACARYGISLVNHHDGEDDAINCAKLYLAYVNGETPLSDSELPEQYKKAEEHKDFWASYYDGHDTLRGDVLKMDLEGADSCNPFYARKVVITGVFNIDRCELAQKLKSMGADIDTCVGPKLKYILIGDNPGPSKIKKVDDMIASGIDVRKIYQEDLDAIFAGKDFDKYHTDLPRPKEIVKKHAIRKTTWPNLVEKFKRKVEGECVEFNERELASEDLRLIGLYYTQQQKIATTKATILENLRQLNADDEIEFRKQILACFSEGESIPKSEAYDRMQIVFTKFGLNFKAKKCVLTEFNVEYKEFMIKGIHHINIISIPNNE